MIDHLTQDLIPILRSPAQFAARAGRIRLRPYQAPVVEAIARSIRNRLGLTFVVIFPRQSGKNETQLALYIYLLTHAQRAGGDIIHIEPTYKPQTETAMYRLETKLKTCPLTRGKWRKRSGYIYLLGNARVVHFSGEPTANVVGSTAGLLISCNEAQDITATKYDKDFDPMAASANATRVFWGTRWTSDTLLEREYKAALAAQETDGGQRVFLVTADDVGKIVPEYKDFVFKKVSTMGREHPLVKTQYFCETIDAQAGMFPPARIMLMRGDHPKRETPEPGKTYALLIDVAGQDEKSLQPEELDNPARDATACTIVEISPDSIPLLLKPTYRAANRLQWTGDKHTVNFARICALDELWHFQYIVIDATGVGEGLWSLLDSRYGDTKIIPVRFSEKVKSDIGYGYISIIETGRYREYSPIDDRLLAQLESCRSEARPGANRHLAWGVPDGKRDSNGQYLHDDLVISASLVAILDSLDWAIQTQTAVLYGVPDPLEM